MEMSRRLVASKLTASIAQPAVTVGSTEEEHSLSKSFL
jgi:hypothetical protein